MKIGFIGAGKMGFTLGKHFSSCKDESIKLLGYYSRNCESAKEAAKFTDTNYYANVTDLVNDSDAIFITVPDGQIAVVADDLKKHNCCLEHKILCHTSGALSSHVFSGMGNHVYGYSIHPIYAVNSKTESYINFQDSFITIEGHPRYLNDFVELFSNLGHGVKIISADDKEKYHSAAVFSSNLVIGLYHMATGILEQCGFEQEEAERALKPLFQNNANNLYKSNCFNALTGPVARCDTDTVKKHLRVLEEEEKMVYRLLSEELIKIVDGKNEFDYSLLKELMRGGNDNEENSSDICAG